MLFGRRSEPAPSDGDKQTFTQKGYGWTISISLDKNSIAYNYASRSGESSFSVDYEQVDPQSGSYVEKNPLLLSSALLILFFAIVEAVRCATGTGMAGLAGLLAGTATGLFTALALHGRRAFSTIVTAKGRMLIACDKAHDEILRALHTRRVTVLRGKYLQIDHQNLPRAELAKYNWLRQMAAITDIEHAQFASMLRGGTDPAPGQRQPPTISLN